MKTLFCVAIALLAAGCQLAGTGADAGQTAAEVKQVQEKLVPVVKKIPGGDRETLWKATESYMQRVFAASAIALHDPVRQVMETRLLEHTTNGQPARTVVTVQVADDPEVKGGARLGVIAQRIDARMDLGKAESGRPVPTIWVMVGNNETVAGEVAEQIMQRYLLLRAGRDPDAELPAPRRIGDAVPERDATRPFGATPIR